MVVAYNGDDAFDSVATHFVDRPSRRIQRGVVGHFNVGDRPARVTPASSSALLATHSERWNVVIREMRVGASEITLQSHTARKGT